MVTTTQRRNPRGKGRKHISKARRGGPIDKTPKKVKRFVARRQSQTWEDDDTWTVEYIVAAEVASDTKGKHWRYFTKWYQYPNADNTWETEPSFSICKFPVIETFWRNTTFREEPDANHFRKGQQVSSSQEYQRAASKIVEQLVAEQAASDSTDNNAQLSGIPDQQDVVCSRDRDLSGEAHQISSPQSSASESLAASPQIPVNDIPAVSRVIHPVPSPADVQAQRMDNSLYLYGDINQYEVDLSSHTTVDPRLVAPGLWTHPHFIAASTLSVTPSSVNAQPNHYPTIWGSRNRMGGVMGSSTRTTTISMSDPDVGSFRRHTASSKGRNKRKTIFLETNYGNPTGETKYKHVSNLAARPPNMESRNLDDLPNGPIEELGTNSSMPEDVYMEDDQDARMLVLGSLNHPMELGIDMYSF